MTFLQRIIRFLGLNTGSPQKDSKSPPKKRKSNLTLSEESNRMSNETPSPDSNCRGNCNCNCLDTDKVLESYREAAKFDRYLFGDYECEDFK